MKKNSKQFEVKFELNSPTANENILYFEDLELFNSNILKLKFDENIPNVTDGNRKLLDVYFNNTSKIHEFIKKLYETKRYVNVNIIQYLEDSEIEHKYTTLIYEYFPFIELSDTQPHYNSKIRLILPIK